MKQFAALALISLFTLGISAQQVKINQSFEDVTEVDINVIFSNIQVKAIEGNTVKVNGEINWSNAKEVYEIKAYKNGTRLIIEVEHPKRNKGNASGEFVIEVPALTDIKANSISGNIHLFGVGQRAIRLNTISGDITGEKLTGDLKINSISGDVNLSDVRGHINTSTISGDHYLTDINGNLTGSSISGDFKIVGLNGNRQISTVSGSVR